MVGAYITEKGRWVPMTWNKDGRFHDKATCDLDIVF